MLNFASNYTNSSIIGQKTFLKDIIQSQALKNNSHLKIKHIPPLTTIG